MSTLPGYRATKRRYGTHPTRDQWIQYLEDYAAHHRLDIRFGTEVDKVVRADDSWQVLTDAGVVEAKAVVVATGYDHEPFIPDWKGRDDYPGELLHSSAYVDPSPFRGKDVLVVGPGVTGSELAYLLLEGGANVTVSVRRPPHFTRRMWFLRVPVQAPGAVLNHAPVGLADAITSWSERMEFGDLTPYGLPRPSVGVATLMRAEGQSPAFDEGFVEAVKGRRIAIVPAVEGFDGVDILLADGSRTTADVVIAATGYRRGLDPLVGHLGVLDERGTPLVTGGRMHPDAPGIFFNGFRIDLSGQLRMMRHDARSIARAVSRWLTNAR